MSKTSHLTVLAALGLATAPALAQSADTCGANRFANLVGLTQADFDADRLPPGHRILKAGEPFDGELEPDRLNLSLDSDGRVSAVWCG